MRTSDHDAFHRPTSDDPWWQETAWFTLMVPERPAHCYVYPWVKANQGILGGGVMVWDDRGRHPWDAMHWDYQWTYPYPELGDLRDITFPTGIAMQLRRADARTTGSTYEHPRCSIDVTFDAILPAHVLGRRGRHVGHVLRALDQQGHVTGSITIDGERLDVDCYAMRDRSWGPTGTHTRACTSATTCCAEARSAFVVFSQPDAPGSPIVENFGYLWRDGEQLPLRSGAACSSATACGRAG